MSMKIPNISLLWLSFLCWQCGVANSQAYCGGTLMKAFGYLTSPNYPNNYNHDSDCSWIISAARGHKITFKVTHFRLESDRSCGKDYLEIFDGPNLYSPSLGRYCGTNKPLPVTSSTNKLYIRFKTNSAKEFMGFRAMFNSSLVCGGTYKRSRGSLSSPNSPHNYYSSSDCLYKIVVPRGHTVKVRFTKFYLEPAQDSGQCYDYVQVHDGKTVLAPSLGKFCGNLSPFTVRSTSHVIIVRFISDKSINRKGFQLTYTAEVPGGSTTQRPRVTTPTTAATVCLSIEFRCGNGKCIDRRWKCDRQDDCGDLSDERGCPCRRYQFKCDNGRCTDRNFVCDGADDCGDGSDEKNCTKPTTPSVTVSCSRANGGCEHTCIQSIVRGSVAVRCQCKPGYKLQPDGKSCRDINECSQSNKVCQQRCLNIPGSYVCACRRGYALDLDKVTCKDIDECKMKNNGDCDHTCINKNGSYSCACRPGFQLHSDGKKCYDIDECSFGNVGCSHSCKNLPGGFQCQCPQSYTLRADNKTCQDVNECAVNNGGCEYICVNMPGSHRCECPQGYMPDVMKPTHCLDINECMEGIPSCFNCINKPGSYECDCDPGFVANANKTGCLDIDECAVNNGGCGPHKCVNSFGFFHCECLKGYILNKASRKCQDVDECAVNGGTGDCQHLCINTVGSYKCGCRAGFKLQNERQCVDIDECASASMNKCQHNCTNTVGSFICSCKTGYHKAIDGHSCNKRKLAPGCGVALKAKTPKRRGWQDAVSGSWPWSVLLHFESFGDIEGCMGTLIDKDWILTTSHCVHLGPYKIQPQFIKVELGAHLRGEGKPNPTLLNVKRIVINNNFKADLNMLSSNIAMLQLSQPVNFTENVLPICLPTRQETRSLVTRRNKGVIIGWGKNVNHKIHGNLRQNLVTMTRRHRCSWAQRTYDSSKLLCAGYSSNQVTCISDSGSPLMFSTKHAQNPRLKRWIMGGMLSWGLNTFSKSCHRDYSHTAYVNIGSYLKWIRSNMKAHQGS